MNSLSVIIPAYNEETAITGTLIEVDDYLKKKGYRYEILVMDDGCSDRTPELVQGLKQERHNIRLIQGQVNRGKGKVLRDGVLMAQMEWTLFMDADNATSIREWDRMESMIQQGARVVIASRHLPESRMVHPQPFSRRFMGSVYRLLSRTIFGLSQTDFNCGFKAYESGLAKQVFGKLLNTDWTFDVELLCLLKQGSINVTEVPVTWSHHEKTSHGSLLKTGFKSLQSLLELRKRLPKILTSEVRIFGNGIKNPNLGG